MKRVAVLFDSYGNPTQPFLKEWFFRIAVSKSIGIRGFTDKFFSEEDKRITALKSGRMKRSISSLRQIIDPDLGKVKPQLVPLARYKPDVIHLLNAQQVDQYGALLNQPAVKSVFSFRGYETSVRPQQDTAWAGKLRDIYKAATRLHFVSDFLKEEAIALGAPREKCVVIRRSVDTDFFRPVERQDARDDDAVRFIAVGRLTWQKGYNVLLRAFSEIVNRYPRITLTIVGDGPDAAIIKQEIESLGLTEKVRQIPHLERIGLCEALRQADIFIQASLSDALPNSILEASACGLPVVSTLVGGIPEAVKCNHTGLLVEPGDVGAFRDAMVRMLEDANLRRTFGGHGRKFIEESFSSEQECKNWEDFYVAI